MGFWDKILGRKSEPAAQNGQDIINQGENLWWRGSTWTTDTMAGENVNQDAMLTSATVYACSKVLSETLAGLPGEIYRDMLERHERDRRSKAYDLLSIAPNEEMDAFTFWELITLRVANLGNFYAEIQRDNSDQIVAIWPIHNSRVRPLRDSGGELYWEVSQDYTGTPEYEDPTWRREYLRYLTPHNFLNIVGFGSQNGIIAPGMLPGAQEIGLDFATRRYGADFFRGGAAPSGFVEHPGFIADPTKRQLFRDDINRIHSSERHKMGVLWENAKYHQVSVSPDQAQFLETRKFTADQICKFYGVPPAIIGDYKDSKFATADAMIRAFVMTTLRNLVVRFEKAIHRQILNVRDENGRMTRAFSKPLIYKFALDGLLRGDPKAQAEMWEKYRTMGVASTNEVRDDIGLNPVKGEEGDYLIVNGGMARLDRIDDQGTRSGQEQPATQTTEPAAYNKALLIEALAELVDRESPKVTVPAATVDGATTLREAFVDVATDALDRVHKITLTQIERWREQDPEVVKDKMTGFWQKQHDRLAEALIPADKIARRINPKTEVAENILTSYVDHYKAVDYHDIFSATNNPVTITEEML